MTLDELLKQGFTFLDQAQKAVMPDKIDPQSANFPEDFRQRQIAELKASIDALSKRKSDAALLYDQAIAAEQAELDSLSKQMPVAAPKAADPAKTPMRDAAKPAKTPTRDAAKPAKTPMRDAAKPATKRR